MRVLVSETKNEFYLGGGKRNQHNDMVLNALAISSLSIYTNRNRNVDDNCAVRESVAGGRQTALVCVGW